MNRHLFLGSPDRWTKAWIEGQPIPPGPTPPEPAPTRFTLANGTVEEYSVNGNLDKQWLAENGFYDDSQCIWLKDITAVEVGSLVSAVGGFDGCQTLRSAAIDSAETILDQAFKYCYSLENVTIGKDVRRIDADAFLDCNSLTAVYIEDLAAWCSIELYNYEANPLYYAHDLYLNGALVEDLVIPEGVAEIHDELFWSGSFSHVSLPDSLQSIGDSAFINCTNLTDLVVPSNVTFIDGYAFYNCSSLSSVQLGSGLEQIGEHVFENCNSLASITIPENVSRIGMYAFAFHGSLETVLFLGKTLDEVKDIPDESGEKEYPWGLDESVIVPEIVEDVVLYTTAESPSTWLESVPEFDASTGTFSGFAEKSDAVKVIIPSKVNNVGVTSIGSGAFCDCSGLTSVTIPDSVTNIGDGAFSGCSGLTSVTIPDGVTSIKWRVFGGCSGLTSMTIPNSVTSIGGYAFEGCSGLTSVTIGNSVTSIGNNAFCDCSGLTSVMIPDSVTSIGGSAFAGCSGLTSVTMPNSVTSIGPGAFGRCSRLTTVEFEGNAPAVGTNAFNGVASGCKAVISPTATGFPAAGQTWNGLIVEVMG